MAIDTDFSNIDYPSITAVHLFWEKAKEEFNSGSFIDQKDGCEKAFRSATEAIDILLSHFGFFVPIGRPEAHVKRAEYLTTLSETNSEIKKILSDYSLFKDLLHGIAFYSNSDPKKFKSVFESVGNFIKMIEEIVKQ